MKQKIKNLFALLLTIRYNSNISITMHYSTDTYMLSFSVYKKSKQIVTLFSDYFYVEGILYKPDIAAKKLSIWQSIVEKRNDRNILTYIKQINDESKRTDS